MGRVYKALAKNWKESQAPAGHQSVNQNGAPPSAQREASPAPPAQVTAAATLPAAVAPPPAGAQPEVKPDVKFEAVFAFEAPPSVPTPAVTERVVEYFNPSKTLEEGLESLRAPGLSELSFNSQQVTEWNDAPRRLHVAPPPPVKTPPPPFVEPNATVDASRLNVEPHLVAFNKSDLLASERYRTLAVRLFNLASRQQDKKLKTLLITSTREGEGKTTVAANLAWVMAKAPERRVLLIDADVQKPAVCKKLNINTNRGWLDLIDGKAKFVEAAVRLDPSGLYVMSPRRAGAEFSQAADSLTSSRVEKLFTELEQYFDFIIIDAPAISDSADAQRIASIVDGTVLVTRAGQTHHAEMTEALKLVPKERRLGVVLNGAEMKSEELKNKKRKR